MIRPLRRNPPQTYIVAAVAIVTTALLVTGSGGAFRAGTAQEQASRSTVIASSRHPVAGMSSASGTLEIAKASQQFSDAPAQPPLDGAVYSTCSGILTLFANGAIASPNPWAPPPPDPSLKTGNARDQRLYKSYLQTYEQDQTIPSALGLPALAPADSDSAGFSNAVKLDESALLPAVSVRGGYPGAPGGFNYTTNTRVGPANDPTFWFCQFLTGQLDYQGLSEFPPTRATFLAFGFTPVTATVHLEEATADDGSLIPVTETAYQQFTNPNYYDPGQYFDPNDSYLPSVCNTLTGTTQQICNDIVITATASVTLRLTDVTVNGTPVDIGDRCQTVGPLYTPGSPADPGGDRVVLTGGTNSVYPYPQFGSASVPGQGNSIFTGGEIAGGVTIPAFAGCVTPAGDNLDPLLDASVSGPGNYVKTTVGELCTIGFIPGACTPNALPPTGQANPPSKIYH
jgi:hypothetical protein